MDELVIGRIEVDRGYGNCNCGEKCQWDDEDGVVCPNCDKKKCKHCGETVEKGT